MKYLYALLLVTLLAKTQAQSDQYLHFDRVDDFVELPNASALIANAPGITMTGWFYTDQYAYGQGMMGIRGTNAGFYLIQLDNGKIECRYQNSAGVLYEYVAPFYSIQLETWQHFAWVFTGNKVELYINGVLKGSRTAGGKITSTTTSFAIGKSILAGFNFVYGGRVDEVTLWKKALTATEIKAMQTTEPTGTEPDLVVYYKMNQGVPGGDNTSLTKVISKVGGGAADADLRNFALNGPTSNFNGVLNTSFQAITFPLVPNKLTSAAPFTLNAAATSGLPVSYEIVSGPATLSGNTVTLTGQPGKVTIKASQSGDASFKPADDVSVSFQVLDPQTFVPDIDVRSPLAGDVFVPSLSPIQLAAIVKIDYPELFSVQNVRFELNGQTVAAQNHGNRHYTGWWTPPSYGAHEMKIIATNNYGANAVATVALNVVANTGNIEAVAATDVWLNSTDNTKTVEANLPSFLGAFDKITAVLQVKCPTGGCGEWDRVASIDAKTHDGRWVEIIRYITPYGTPCVHEMDATDYMSLLQGKIAFRLNNGTLDNGYLFNLKFKYQAGTPTHKYSAVNVLWQKNYPFGDLKNLQPVEPLKVKWANNAVASTLKLVSSGHGWGDNNTGNAAEFHDDTHHIWVNGNQTFTQRNWMKCNPNPNGCQPQSGTWYFDRAGWCPGSIAPWFNFDMTPFIGGGQSDLGYRFDEDYKDLCHVNNPSCVSGVTCPDCNDGYNPFLVVACNLITFADGPVGETNVTDVNDARFDADLAFSVFPNPSADGVFNFFLKDNAEGGILEVSVTNALGQRVGGFSTQNNQSVTHELHLENQPNGVYRLNVRTEKGMGSKMLLISK